METTHDYRSASEPGTSLMPPWGWIFSVVWGIAAGVLWFPRAVGDDWASLWIGGRLVAEGNWEEAYAVSPTDFAYPGSAVWDQIVAEHTSAPFTHPFVHNPGVGVVMSLVSRALSFEASLLAITVLCAFAVPLLAAAAYTFWTSAKLRLSVLIAATVFIWLTVPLVISRVVGQTTPIIIASCVAAMALASTRPRVAGLLLAAAAFVKLTPVVLVAGMLALPATRRAGAWAAGVLSALFAAQLVFLPTQFALWAATLASFSDAHLSAPMNATIGSILYAGERTTEGVVVVRDGSALPTVLTTVVVVGGVLALFAWTWRRAGAFPGKVFLTLCLLGPMVVSQILWLHYSVALVLPIAGMLAFGIRSRAWPWLVFAAAVSLLLLIRIDFTTNAAPSPVTVLHFVLWIAVVAATAVLRVPRHLDYGLERLP
ncbi:glycosyltransferase 87 family protein [Corynebacterium qintianiae]|uniref:glycosyltransferase 87 family protein n=1 Tax=Corynebacterium qintianiae TaxID=2709392 RepID=UPI0013EBFDB2|nr:glycosyltransferase 87 family protein [Corynebacterium qintianiae]